MIQLIILIAPLFFIGRYFAELAFEHEKPRFGFGALGVGIYIVSYFIFSTIVGLIGLGMMDVNPGDSITTMSNKLEMISWIILFSSIGLASVVCWLVFRALKSSWKKTAGNLKDSSLIDKF